MTEFKVAYGDYVRVSTPVIGESLTKQSEKDACDINLIANRYMKAGYNPDDMPSPSFGEDVMDVSDAPDYQTAMNVVAQNNSAFEALPSAVRLQFMNSPAKWMDALIKESEAKAVAEASKAVSPQGAVSTPAEQKGSQEPAVVPKGATE